MMDKFKKFNKRMDWYLDRYDRWFYSKWVNTNKTKRFIILNLIGLGLAAIFLFWDMFIAYVLSGLVIIHWGMYNEECKRHIVREL
jgi:hypothetical protein